MKFIVIYAVLVHGQQQYEVYRRIRRIVPGQQQYEVYRHILRVREPQFS